MFTETNNQSTRVPPPWRLVGSGFILLYRFSKPFVQQNGFLHDFQKDAFKSGWGTVMIVDYRSSPVGPYFELLFIPGIFSFQNQNAFSISKIYVSTAASVVNGIENWGIPKEKADFSWTNNSGRHCVQVFTGGQTVFEAELKTSWLRFPITTSLLPLRIVQEHQGRLLLTRPAASGSARVSSVISVKTDPHFFPDLSNLKPLLTLHVENFNMEFPLPIVL